MKHTLWIASVLVAVTAVACTKNTSEPSSSTTTTTAATTTVATTTVATTSIPVQTSFNVTGTVTSNKDGARLSFADIEIIQGANIGKRFQADNNGNYTMTGLAAGAFVARFWAPGYFVNDVLITISTANLTMNVQLTPAPPTTTTTVGANLQANFSWSPDPCTLTAGGTNCTVTSTSTGDIASTQWLYAGKTVNNQNSIGLTLACADLIGTGTVRTVSVRLNVTGTDGSFSTIDIGVPVNVGDFCK